MWCVIVVKNLKKPNSIDFYLDDWRLTGGTFWREESVVIGFTIGQAILLTERIQIERLVTLHAGETFRMPSLSECGNNFLHDYKQKSIQFEKFGIVLKFSSLTISGIRTSVIGFLQAKHLGKKSSLK